MVPPTSPDDVSRDKKHERTLEEDDMPGIILIRIGAN